MQPVNSSCVQGVDVSHWQGAIDWHAVKNAGIKFAYVKATEGRTTVDPKYLSNALGARSAGLATSAYHFARPDLNPTLDDAREEARNFINTLQKGFGAGFFGDIDPALDLEVPIGKNQKAMPTEKLLAWARAFKSYFKTQTGRSLMIYTGQYFIKAYNNFNYPFPGNPLADMPLWIAMYPTLAGNSTSPPDQGSWTKWTIWQYTSSGKVAGIDGNVDLNWAMPELFNRK
ncbi:MAG: glycoside hydrolase family 25 protein [Bacillota bacterium]